jgi:hypothetical protein
MTMDQQLFEELYGTNNPEGSDEQIKEAQAELIEAVADEAGINLNELDDGELDKFAEYCLTPEGAEQHLDPNLATADAMGRQMAHSYADEQIKIASQLQGDDMYDYDDVLLEKAAEWEMFKEAASLRSNSPLVDKAIEDSQRGGFKAGVGKYTGYSDLKKGLHMRKQYKRMLASDARTMSDGGLRDALEGDSKAYRNLSDKAKKMMHRQIKVDAMGGSKSLRNRGAGSVAAMKAQMNRNLLRGAGKAGAVAAGAGALGYGGYRMAKKSSYDPSVAWIEDLEGVEFAKLAEFRAAEILAANGVDPDTFEECYPEHIKVANFPEPEDAVDYDSAAEIDDYNDVLDDAALDILEELGFLD